MYNSKELKLRLTNMELDYIRFGKGKRVMIMIQGLNTRGIKGAGLSLAYMYRLFAKEYTVYLFDRRPNVHDGITVREMAGDIAMAMDALGLSKADVLGVSEGGMIAQYLAIDRPDLVNRLVLAVTASRSNPVMEKTLADWIEMTREEKYNELVRDMAEKMYSDRYLKRYRPLLPLLTLLQRPRDKERFITLTKSCLTCESYDMLDKITCPTLVIGGGKDRLVTPEASIEIAKKMGCRLHMYEDLGHAAYEEASDFNKIVYEFFTE